MIDPDTPDNAKTRTGFDGEAYELVFSDEFNVDGRTFYPGDDPFWEAADIWYGSTADVTSEQRRAEPWSWEKVISPTGLFIELYCV